MIISISGKPGTGKTTLARGIGKKLGLEFHSVGNYAREIAKKRGISIFELDKLAVNDATIDKEIDSMHLKLQGKDNLAIDSRIAFYFFPHSFKIFLVCKPEIAAERIFKARRLGESGGIKKLLKEIKERNKVDTFRYKKYYNVDIADLNNFDLIVDTSDLNIEEMNNVVLDAIKKLKAKQ